MTADEKDFDEDELEVEVEETEEEVSETETESHEDDGDEDAVEASEEKKPRQSKFKKRIDDLVHKQREAERQRDEYYKVAQKMIDENNKLRLSAKQYSESSAEEMEARLNTELEQAKSAYRKAYEEGDADAILEAQDRMFKANAQNSRLEKLREEANSPRFTEEAPSLAPPPDTRAIEWASRNPWFNQNKVMTSAAYAIHDEVIAKGVSPDGNPDEYYESVDRRMREEFPQYFKDQNTDTSGRRKGGSVAQVVTPGGNETSRSKRVRLSPSQVAVANRLGVPLEEYAKQFVALDN